MRTPRRGPSAWPYAILLAAWLAGTGAAVRSALASWQGAPLAHAPAGPVLAIVLVLVTLAESLGLFFLLGFLAKGAAYLFMREHPSPPPASRVPPVAVLYLTAGDFDAEAVDSLLRLESDGPLLFVLHDDGRDEGARAAMHEFVEHHPCRGRWEAVVWHRPERTGGKAGAVNWVLERLDARWQLLLLCDSDSIALDLRALPKAAAEFEDASVAVVQFRNVGVSDDAEPGVQRRLTLAIDVFDAFAQPQARWGYLPFFGHNAIIRLADLRALGGLTPGFFSDDLDLSVRLTLSARRIVYRPDVRFGERHPGDWTSFRKRSRKWAFGCMQVVRSRLGAVLTTPGVPFAQRIGMLEFMGFYPAQALLLCGLLLGHLVLPWLASAPAPSPGFAAWGALVALALVAPTLAWSLRNGRVRDWPAFAWICALVYGGSIVPTAQGVLDGLSTRERPWIPTNLSGGPGGVPRSAWLECALGIALFASPWAAGSPAVGFVATYLFVSTFLFSPLTHLAYRAPVDGPEPVSPPAPALTVLLLALTLLTLPTHAQAASPPAAAQVHGDRLWVDGAPFEVRGVHYSPWLPGTGPDGRSPYPDRRRVARDLAAIRSLGANTILVHDAPGWVLRMANERGLHSIVAFHIGWADTTAAAFERRSAGVLAAIDSLRSEPGLIAWLLGNEIPAWVVDTLGARTLEQRLHTLADHARQIDPAHLLGHGNWPPTLGLDLSFLDLACFNLYPAWPYEVAVRGYGPYLREVIRPAARGKPVLITEFGINSLETSEARQGQVITDCWREISGSNTAGGVLFEYCDEWWKNFDNPIPGKGYWQRQYAPDDAARADDDPEENYGIVRADRSPKPAFAAARRMWASESPARPAWWPWLVLLVLGLVTRWAFANTRGTVKPRPLPPAGEL